MLVCIGSSSVRGFAPWGQHNSELHRPHVYSDPLCVSNQCRLSAVEIPKDVKVTTEQKEFICQWTPCLIYSCSGQLEEKLTFNYTEPWLGSFHKPCQYQSNTVQRTGTTCPYTDSAITRALSDTHGLEIFFDVLLLLNVHT